MSKIFSAKRKEIEITYEFLDGTTTQLNVVSLSTKEGKEMSALIKDNSATMADFFEKLVPIHLQKNDPKIAKKVMNEQLNEGNIIEFGKAISAAIEEEKAEKGNA
ncbi:MAG: hypothetical protein PHV62_07995 [Sulfuricurvum sp.]|nr:hypothetical protein [Sulfuricurvum sp.]